MSQSPSATRTVSDGKSSGSGPDDATRRSQLAVVLMAVSLLVMLWGLLVFFYGKTPAHILGLRLSSRYPVRLSFIGMVGTAVALWIGPSPAARSIARRLGYPWAIAIALATAILIIAIHWGSTVAGGSDSFGYVSQAGLFRQGRLTLQQPFVRESPWPLAEQTWTPLGFDPAWNDRASIVPQYPPGLSLLMAFFQLAFGYCGAFLVVPLAAAGTVGLTYALGYRLFGRPGVALWGALLVAASPVFLMQALQPMSDVPATAIWSLALYMLVSERPLAAGLAIGTALTVRPNLIFVSLPFLAWALACDFSVGNQRTGRAERIPWTGRFSRVALGMLPFIAGIAWLNNRLYGSPLLTGYGSVDSLYAWSYTATNFKQFSAWVAEAETPIVALALIYFLARRLVPQSRVRFVRALLGAFIVAVYVSYLFYVPFGAWWFLRFLLPMWPAIMLLTALTADALARKWMPSSVAGGVLA
ncbi:MAG TPA: glycosyltransferase family 39 protein, partial [Vicinamibacterales bacterium]|nr:glycosyltransferase family 39 protein [Vicinamibacterales bacterium]